MSDSKVPAADVLSDLLGRFLSALDRLEDLLGKRDAIIIPIAKLHTRSIRKLPVPPEERVDSLLLFYDQDELAGLRRTNPSLADRIQSLTSEVAACEPML